MTNSELTDAYGVLVVGQGSNTISRNLLWSIARCAPPTPQTARQLNSLEQDAEYVPAALNDCLAPFLLSLLLLAAVYTYHAGVHARN